MDGLAKLQVLIEMKNKLTKPFKAVNDKLGKLNQNVDKFKQKNLQAFNAIKQEIPGLERGLELITNPYVAATAAVVGLGIAMGVSTTKAAAFNNEFLAIRNLNLDKTNEQMAQLKDSVLDLSIQEGLDPRQTAKAFYDVQSATGLFGAEVESIVRSVGRFSIATGTELPSSIGSTVKAMKAFNFQADQVDDYLASNARTVQVGITTFEELARVQTEFAGSAASAGQELDTANKIFAAFTTVAKNADIAATLTKDAFKSFTDESTVKALQGINVNLFDADGNMRRLDDVMSELVPKFKTMSDQEFTQLRNAMGGREGLAELMNQLRVNGDKVLEQFEAFDNTQFSVADALKNAKGDATALWQIFSNQIDGILSKIGQNTLPPIITGLQAVTDFISELDFDKIAAGIKGVGTAALSATGFMIALKISSIGLMGGISMATKALTAFKVALMSNPIGVVIGLISALIGAFVYLYETNEKVRGSIKGLWNAMVTFFESIWSMGSKILGNLGDLLIGVFTLDKDRIVKSFNNLKGIGKDIASNMQAEFDFAYNQELIKAKTKNLNPGTSADPDQTMNNTNADATGAGADAGNNMRGVVSGGAQSRNITVNIGSLNEGGINISTTNITESIANMEEKFREMLIRAVRNFEQTA